MKKIMFVIFGILFGFGSNIFGYTWNVRNDTGDTIGVHFCTTWGYQNCQDANIPPNLRQKFEFSDWRNTGLLFGSAIVNGQELTIPVGKDFGGNMKVVKHGTQYTFEEDQ